MKTEKIILAGGCFWGVEAFFQRIPGVIKTTTGYVDGPKPNPTYEQVCNGVGHAEAVEIIFDNSKTSLEKIFEAFFIIIDPTSVNQQGNDKGIQYRTGIYCKNDNQLKVAQKFLSIQQKNFSKPLTVDYGIVNHFYLAEKYHQKYLDKNPNGYCHININESLKKINIK